MKSTFVLASADSRLQADIMMIRLRRAGINIDRVSALFCHRFAPNSFFFWLRSPRTLRCLTKGESFFVAGPIQQLFAGGDEVEAMPSVLRRIGLDSHQAAHFGQSLWLGRGVLCVQAKNQDEASVVWHIFHHSKSEDIAISGQPSTHRAAEPVADALRHGAIPAFAA